MQSPNVEIYITRYPVLPTITYRGAAAWRITCRICLKPLEVGEHGYGLANNDAAHPACYELCRDAIGMKAAR